MGELVPVFAAYEAGGRNLHKLLSYAPIYERLLAPFRQRSVVLVEFGIGKGGCLTMWKDYLGPYAQVIGIDLHDGEFYTDAQITCVQGDQGDAEFLRSLPARLPRPDIVIDDASHINTHQIATLQTLFPHLNPGGVYAVEDTHTSYRSAYGGGYRRSDTFIEYCKNLVDGLHRTEDPAIAPPAWIEQLSSIAFYPSLAVLIHA